MNIIHKQLKDGGWNKLSLAEQLANIGSEVSRTINWREKNSDYSNRAFERVLELIDFSINDPKNRQSLKELCRVREVLVDSFVGDNIYKSTDDLWKRYFNSFNYLVRVNVLP